MSTCLTGRIKRVSIARIVSNSLCTPSNTIQIKGFMPPKRKASKPAAKPNAPSSRKAVSQGDDDSCPEVEEVEREGSKPNGRGRPSKKVKSSAVEQSDASESVAEATASASDGSLTQPSGNFDLYSMRLSFLKDVYLSEGESKPQYEKLYSKILTYQSKNDWSGQIYLPKPDSSERGRFQCAVELACDPFGGMPFEIALDNITFTKKLTFTTSEKNELLTSPTDGPGFSGELEIEDLGCGILDSSGKLKLKRAWTSKKKNDDGTYAELYEGYLQFRVKYGSLYSRKGFGKGGSFSTGIWAVRAAKGPDGAEVGIGPL